MLTQSQGRQWKTGLITIPLLLLALNLAGCTESLFGSENAPRQPQSQVNSVEASQDAFEPSFNIDPGGGHGGVYVRVSGTHWPPNMLVLVALEDAQGRSETLAAHDTDQAGNLATGFLYPIDQRWLTADAHWIVASTADGRVEAKAEFAIVPPGESVASSSSASVTTRTITTTGESVSAESMGEDNITGTLSHTVALPMVTVDEEAANGEASNSGADPTSTSAQQQVTIEVEPGTESKTVNCRDGQGWITLAILSTADFDATAVEPSSVTVSGEAASASDHRQERAVNSWVGRTESRAYTTTWRWRLEDVDQDGRVDLIMEFRLDYIDLTCDAGVLIVAGQTKDGQPFAGRAQVEMIIPDRRG